MKPDQHTLEEKQLDVGDGHQLYAQLWGNENAIETVVFLHGGPGSGCSDSHKTLFDPERQKVLFFDQRGCGRSVPYGSLHENNTDKLISDINALTEAFRIKKFTLTGGSWGSCLALAYAAKNPKRVARMVLRGIFTGRQHEIDFLYKGGWRAFFPEAWQEFVNSVPAKNQDDPVSYHLPRATGKNKEAAKQSAYALSKLEGSVARLDDRTTSFDYDTFDPCSTLIESYYMANNCFMPEGYIMKNADKLGMPIDIVQGRYDSICPPSTAYDLYRRLPDAQLHWTVAGHSGNDRGNWQLTKALLAR